MLIKDLLNEMRFLEPGKMPSPETMRSTYPSTAGLTRENEFLGTLNLDNVEYNFWLSENKTVAKVTTLSQNPEISDDPKERQLTCTEVRFYEKVKLPVLNQIQVSRVYTHSEYRDKWLAGAMYIVLARHGYTVISDLYQYIPGKELWKKLAYESNSRNYSVFVWDQWENDWIRNSNTEPVRYDSNNLFDSEIWHSVNSQKTCLLALTALQKIE